MQRNGCISLLVIDRDSILSSFENNFLILKEKRVLKHLFYLLLIFSLFNSCKRDNLDDSLILSELTEDPQIVNNGSLFGKVVDEQMNPIGGVRISTAESIQLSDEFGFFQITNERFNRKGFQIDFEKSGYFKNSKQVFSTGHTTDNTIVTLIKKEEVQLINNNQPKVIKTSNDISVTIPADGFKTIDDEAYQGEVYFYTKWLSNNSDEFLEIIPGNLSGLTHDQKDVGIKSLGVLLMKAETLGGESLSLLENKELLVSIPNIVLNTNELPISNPTWTLNDDFDNWIEGDEAVLLSNSYEIKVKNLNYLTLGESYEQVYIYGQLVSKDINNDKKSVPSSKVMITDREGTQLTYDITDNEGNFSALIPRNELNQIHIFDQCNNNVETQELMNFESDKNLEEFIVNINSSSSSIIGSLYDCNGFVIENAACLIENGNQTIAIKLEQNENFVLNIFDCNTNDLNFHFVDLDNKAQTENFVRPRETYINCNEVTICEYEMQSSVSFLIEGNTFTFDNVELNEDKVNNILVVRIPMELDPSKAHFVIRLPTIEGNYTNEEYLQLIQLDNSANVNSDEDPLYYRTICLNQDTHCDVSLSITKVEEHLIEGNFIGTLDFEVDYPGNEVEKESHNISCTFSISR